MPFDAFQNNVWTIARSSTENFSPYRPIPPGEEKMVVTFLRPLLCSAAGMARYDFGGNRVATLTLLTITTLPGRRSCGTAMAKFSVTLLPSGARRLFLQTPGCLDPPAPAFYLASHRELSGGFHLGFLTRLYMSSD